MSDQVSGGIFAFVTLVFLVGGIIAIRDAVILEFTLLGFFGIILLGFAGTMGYEAAALWFGFPTISLLTNTEYVAYPLPWIAVFVAIAGVFGALSAHFTYVKTYDWKVAVYGIVAFIIGFAITVITRWTPAP